MNILQISPQYPFPADDGGKIGIANITREFFKRGESVYFFTFGDPAKIPLSAMDEGRRITREIFFCRQPTSNSPARIGLSVIKNKSLFTGKHFNSRIKSDITKFIRDLDIDVIHADHSSIAPLAMFVGSIISKPVGLRLHNVEWQIWKRYADNLPHYHPKRIYINHQAELLKNEESYLYGNVDICFAITANDRLSALELSPKAKVVVAGPGVNLAEWKPDAAIERNPKEMILATTYKWVHNVDALRWFLDNVLPIIRNSVPEAFLTLLGKQPPAWLNDYRDKGLDLVGYVPKVQPYMNKAGIYIAPLFVGAGIRIKILEAMSMRLPVVATPVSANGINAGIHSGLFVSGEAGAFASYVVRLMKDEALRITAGNSAREFIEENFSWENNVGIMLDHYRQLIENSKTKKTKF